MSYPPSRKARDRHPPANVISLPRRPGTRRAYPAGEPLDIPGRILGLLQSAAADLSAAEAVLGPGVVAQPCRGGPDSRRRAAFGNGACSRYSGQALNVPGQSCVEIRLLGRFQVTRAGREVGFGSFGGRRARQLLQILLMERGRLVPKDVLIEALWPGEGPADPVANLAVQVSRARHAVGEASLILGRPGGYLYADDDRSWVDTDAFAHEAERGRLALSSGNPTAALHAYQAALRLWKGGPLMENIYAEWAQNFRRRLALLHEEALTGLARASLELGEAAMALDAARQLTQHAPLSEEGHVLLMKALVAAGNPARAISAFHGWRDRLASELGVDPSRQACDLFQRILRHEPLGYPPPQPQDPAPAGSPRAGEGLADAVLGWLPDAVYLLSRDGRVAYANPAGALITGIPAGCLRGMAACEVFPRDWLDAYHHSAATAQAAGALGWFRAFCVPLGSWLEWIVCPGERGLLVTSRNVTPLVEAAGRVHEALAAVEASRRELRGHADSG